MAHVISNQDWMNRRRRTDYDYPWEEWLDGQARVIEIEHDLHPAHQADPYKFRQLVYSTSLRRGTPYGVRWHSSEKSMIIYPRGETNGS
jgi:hypothetical protein